MLVEVYYEHYKENCQGRYCEKESTSLPYLIRFPTVEDMHRFMGELRSDGLRCVESNHSYRVLLVNLELKRYGVIYLPCKHSCIGDRAYTPEEFVSEVYNDWKNTM